MVDLYLCLFEIRHLEFGQLGNHGREKVEVGYDVVLALASLEVRWVWAE